MDVSILLGSKSDMPIAEKCTKVLDKFGVNYQLRVASAHRSPKFVEDIIHKAEEDGCKVFIAMAGLAAALPGAVAALTTKPVIGVACGGRGGNRTSIKQWSDSVRSTCHKRYDSARQFRSVEGTCCSCKPIRSLDARRCSLGRFQFVFQSLPFADGWN